jgi:hypothetical protein
MRGADIRYGVRSGTPVVAYNIPGAAP